MAREIIDLPAEVIRGRGIGRGDGEGQLVPYEDGGWILQIGHAHAPDLWVHVRLAPDVIKKLTESA